MSATIDTDELEIYYLLDGEETLGPFSMEMLRKMREQGEIREEVLCAVKGAPDWKPVREWLSGAESATHLPRSNVPPNAVKQSYPTPPMLSMSAAASAPAPARAVRPKKAASQSDGAVLSLFGVLLILAGGLGGLVALVGFGTVVGTGDGAVHNIGLISDRQNLMVLSMGILGLGCALLIVGQLVGLRKAIKEK